ncbi:hypothetical protein Enr13x_67950 [Stieleria neptunia]|uniref:Uncharacterized protein n=1 Tax=Stieleria neptunia TaxID=2527979 RepID=A0A518I1E7_9BACT|nr:hypothetical protein Enr13x_67950 [Stieleria neptunia]
MGASGRLKCERNLVVRDPENELQRAMRDSGMTEWFEVAE